MVFFFQAEDGIRDLTVTGVQTCALPISVAWTIRRAENSSLAFETKDGPVNILFAKQDTRVVDEIPGRKIIRAVDDEVVVFEKLKRVTALQLGLVSSNLDIRIQAGESILGGESFGSAHVL